MESFTLCYYNFCPILWHLYGVEDTRKMVRVQYRLKCVHNYSDFNAPYMKLHIQRH